MFAVGLALRGHREFTWARCTATPAPNDRIVSAVWERYTAAPRSGPVDPRDLEVQPVAENAVDRLLVPGAPGERRQLLELLRLPPFLQGLLSTLPGGREPLPVVFSHLNALPKELVYETFANHRVHETLHAGGVSLLATYFGTPDLSIVDAFEQCYRIEDAGGAHWADAFVWSERGPTEVDLLLPRRLREVWSELGLDPGLLLG